MSDSPFYDEYARRFGTVPEYGTNPATSMLPSVGYPDPGLIGPNHNPRAETAGEQDHSDPWRYAGADANPPENPDGVA